MEAPPKVYGNLISMQPVEVVEKKSLPLKPIIFISVIFIILAIGYFVFIQPRILIAQFSNQTLQYIPKLQTSIEKTGESLNNMYNIISGKTESSQTDKLLLRLNLDSFLSRLKNINKQSPEEVAGAAIQTTSSLTFLEDFRDEVKKINDSVKIRRPFNSSNTPILGQSTQLESTRIVLLRKVKEEAVSSFTSAKEGLTTVDDLDKYLDSTKNGSAELLKVTLKLQDNDINAKQYLNEVQKTADYYNQISDIQISLEPVLITYTSFIYKVVQSDTPSIYLDQLKDIKTTVSHLNSQIKQIPLEILPAGIEDLHKDNIKVLEMLRDNVDEVGIAVRNADGKSFANSFLSLQQKLEPLMNRAVTSEQSFWQNNTVLRTHMTLLDNYEEQEKLLKDIKDKNKIVFLTK